MQEIAIDARLCLTSKSIQQMGSCQFDWFRMPSEFPLYSILQILIIPTVYLEGVHTCLYFLHMYFQTQAGAQVILTNACSQHYASGRD